MTGRLADLVSAALAGGMDAAQRRELADLLAADPAARAEAAQQYRTGLLVAGLRSRPPAEIAAMACAEGGHPSRALRAVAAAESRLRRIRWGALAAAVLVVAVLASVLARSRAGSAPAPAEIADRLVASDAAPMVLPLGSAGGEIRLAPRSRLILGRRAGAGELTLLAGSLEVRVDGTPEGAGLRVRSDGPLITAGSAELALRRGANGLRVELFAGDAVLGGDGGGRRLAAGAALWIRADGVVVDEPAQPWTTAAGWTAFPGAAPLAIRPDAAGTRLTYDGAAAAGFAQAVHPVRPAGGRIALRLRAGPHAPEATWNLQLVTADGSCWWLVDRPVAALDGGWQELDLAVPASPAASYRQPGAVFDPADVTGVIISICGARAELLAGAPAITEVR